MRAKRCLTVVLTLVLAWCVLGQGSAQPAYDMPYYIELDLTNQIVTVYNSSDNSIARQMLCTAGENALTPTGNFYLPATKGDERQEWYHMRYYNCWVHYATRVYMGIYFHSLTYGAKGENYLSDTSVEQYGNPGSHGCVRLHTEDVKFIAENCMPGTLVHIYYSDSKNEALRAKLYEQSYSDQSGISYREFQDIPEDAFALGSKGDEVGELQLRLRDLGYYGGELDGNYSSETIKAVKLLQRDLGLTQTGIVTVQLREVIFSDAAPVSTAITLTTGMSGPVVLNFQQTLSKLGIYEGELDGIYDAEVVDAVRELQRLCSCDVDGIASPEVQQLAGYELMRIKSELGDDFGCERVKEDVNIGTVNLKDINAVVRSKASTESDQLTQLRPGESAIVLATNGEWAQLLCKEGTGYMYTDFLTPSVEQNTVMSYTANGKTVTLGNTLEQMANGSARDERESFLAYVEQAGSKDYTGQTVEYATVNTGSASVALNLRAQASDASEVLGQIPNGTRLRVLGSEEGFTCVGYDDQIGYLMDDYLSFTEGFASDTMDTSHALDPNYSSKAQQSVPAVVMTKRGNTNLKVYKEASTDSQVVGYVGWSTKVMVLEDDEQSGWALVENNKLKGYMPDRYLTYSYYFINNMNTTNDTEERQ